MAHDINFETNTLVMSVFKGGSFYFNDENTDGKSLWDPADYYDWSEGVAVTNKYAFTLNGSEGVVVHWFHQDKTRLFQSKQRVRSIDANDEKLFIGAIGLHVIELSELPLD